ncbi:MAG: S46 family peptidase [Gammaproteobacteria bacterium]
MRQLTFLTVLILLTQPLFAEEGMWTLDNFPGAAVNEKYGAKIDQDWLDHVRLSTTRIEGGCTGSFVSPDGLVLTNHHCVRRCISDNSSPENDLQENGFVAASREDEASCPSDQLSVLVQMDDITKEIEKAVAGKTEAAANEARKQTLTRLESECEAAATKAGSPRSCESVNLYNGGQYFIYQYKRYDDIRLVFAPEGGIAHFGGDPDNFNFPRWCLDMSFLRAYEDGEPASTPQHLAWRKAGAEEGEAVFITGHPGSTDRLLTVAELRFLRDVSIPVWLLRYSELRGRYRQFAAIGDEPHRVVQEPLLRLENGIKVRRNQLFSLLDEEVMAAKQSNEDAFRNAVMSDPELASAYGSAWQDIEDAIVVHKTFYEPWLFAEQSAAFSTIMFNYARNLVRVAAEKQVANEKRLREYTDAALPGLRQVTLAARPIDADLETVRLTFSLEKMREWLGPDDPFVHQVLGGASPASRAKELIHGSQLADAGFRESLWDGGADAIAKSDDPLIVLARNIDAYSRDLRKRYEDQVEAPINTASEQLAAARFKVQGTSTYPDATFTLRVTYGSVTGWEEKGEYVVPFTQTRRLFERATGEDPFRVPPAWVAAEKKLNLDTRFNFVATTDITGGNSGSPLIDKNANLVGLAFDGNIHSIAGSYVYDESMNRTVAVHPAIMIEALTTVYDARHIAEELELR